MDYSKFFSQKSGRRKYNLIRQITEIYINNPNLIPLAGGLPNTETFPFQEIDVTYKDGTRHRLTGKELDTALQYGPSQGYPPLLKTWREFQNRWHSPPRQDWVVAVTTGSQEASSKILELLLDEGDAVMVQVPVYAGTLGAIYPLAADFIEIEQDENGIIPEKIRAVCEARKREGRPQPKLLCVNPTGANPTGAVLSEERRPEIYAIAQKYDFLILEDDAYYFVNFLDYRPTSFFSMDTDGRVIRLDSMSKILSSGIRIGILSAHKDIVNRLIASISSSTLHTSSLSQVLVHKLLSSWGPEKFDEHLKEVQAFYKEKRDIMVSLVEKHLTGLAEWSASKGGMFLWIKITAVENVHDLAMNEFIANGVLVVPGIAFNHDFTVADQHLRLSYSCASSEDIDRGLAIIAAEIRKRMAKNNSGSQ